MSVCVCVGRVHACVCTYMCMCMYVSMYMHIHVCSYMCVCLCLCYWDYSCCLCYRCCHCRCSGVKEVCHWGLGSASWDRKHSGIRTVDCLFWQQQTGSTPVSSKPAADLSGLCPCLRKKKRAGVGFTLYLFPESSPNECGLGERVRGRGCTYECVHTCMLFLTVNRLCLTSTAAS